MKLLTDIVTLTISRLLSWRTGSNRLCSGLQIRCTTIYASPAIKLENVYMSVLFWTAVFTISPPRRFHPRSDSNRQNGSLDIEVSQCTASNFWREGGIRTHGALSRSLVFKTRPIDHSGTSPYICTPKRIRTFINGFGDRHATVAP